MSYQLPEGGPMNDKEGEVAGMCLQCSSVSNMATRALVKRGDSDEEGQIGYESRAI